MNRAVLTRSMPPSPLRGFEGIHRYWDAKDRIWIAQVLPGEFCVSRETECIATVLGSCVSTCMRDPEHGIGGINHFMLPHEPSTDTTGQAMRYGCFALERLINELIKWGARRAALEIKVFGGGRIIAGMGDVGRGNIEFVRHYLADEGLRIAAEDVGGPWARRVRYYPASGRALVRRLETSEARRLSETEQKFKQSIAVTVPGEVELFD